MTCNRRRVLEVSVLINVTYRINAGGVYWPFSVAYLTSKQHWDRSCWFCFFNLVKLRSLVFEKIRLELLPMKTVESVSSRRGQSYRLRLRCWLRHWWSYPNFTMGEHCEIWPNFSSTVQFDSSAFKNVKLKKEIRGSPIVCAYLLKCGIVRFPVCKKMRIYGFVL